VEKDIFPESCHMENGKLTFVCSRGTLNNHDPAQREEEDPMNCKVCGAPLEDGVTLCPGCGADNTQPEELLQTAAEEAEQPVEAVEAALTAETEEPAQTPEEEQPETPEEEQPETPQTQDEALSVEEETAPAKPRLTPAKLALLIGAGVLLVAVLVFAVLQGLGYAPFKAVKEVEDRPSYTVTDDKAAKKADTVVATAGDCELTNALLQVHYWMQVTDYLNYYGVQFDYTKPLSGQKVTGTGETTWEQYFVDISLQTWHRYAVLCMLAREEGHVLSDTQKDNLEQLPARLEQSAKDAGFASADAMLAADMGAGATIDAYVQYLNDYALALEYFNAKVDAFEPTMEQIEAFYAANEADFQKGGVVKGGSRVVDVRHILLYPEGAKPGVDNTDVCTEDQWEACRLEAEKLLEQWQEDPTEEHFAEMAAEHSADSSASDGGLIAGIYAGRTVKNFDAWSFDEGRKYGDCGVVKTEYGYHLIYFVQSQEEWIGVARDNLISENANKIIDDAQARWPMDTKLRKIALGELNLGG